MKGAQLLILIFFCLCSNVVSMAQSSSGWAWALRDSLNDAPIGLATDGAGNVYSAGPVLTKHNANGALVWKIKLAGNLQYLETKALAVDGAGNVYIAGNFPFSITLDTITLTSAGKRDIFVAKFNSSGRIQWARKAGGPGPPPSLPSPGYIDDTAFGIALDSVGNVYITGGYHTLGTAVQFDSLTIPPNTGRAFMAKYNPAGKIRWVTPLSNPETQKISITSQGILILRGFELTCYNAANGMVKWAKTKTGTGYAACWGYYNDAAGNSYLTGSFYGTINFSHFNLTSTLGTGPNGQDVFLVKYDPSGNVRWAVKSTGVGSSNGEAVTADNQGNVYVTGSYAGNVAFGTTTQLTNSGMYPDIFVVKYDSAGTALWADMANSGDYGYGSAIACSTNGDVYVAGQIKNGGVFGTHTLVSASGYSEFFLAKHSGNLLGLPKTKAASNLQLYPNPASLDVHITNNFKKKTSLEIYNLTGQKIHETVLETETNLNVSEYPAGLYLVKITSEGKTETQKLIVTH